MKILVVGDPHFKLNYPYGELIEDGRRAERAAVLSAIHAEAEDCYAVVLMGDNLDKRHNHSGVIKEFVDFLEGFGDKQVYILSGNHETFEGKKTAIDFLIGMRANWTVITPGWTGVYSDQGLGFVPYMTNSSLGVKTKEEGTEAIMAALEEIEHLDAVFVHHAISGTETAGTLSDLFEEIVLPRERLEKVAWQVVGGHIHQPQVVGRTIVTGNIFSHDVGDTEKCVWKLNLEDETYEKAPLPIRPIYKVLNPTMEELDTMSSSAIVKAILTEKGQDVEAIKERLKGFDGRILVESYPNERSRIHVDSAQELDLSIDALLELYAKAKKKDIKRLRRAFKIISEAS